MSNKAIMSNKDDNKDDNKDSKKDGKFKVIGVVDSYNRDVYKVLCSFGEVKNVIQCTLSGKMRKNSIKVLDGDRVTVEIDQYDTTKGRIVSRERMNQAPRR